MVLVSTKDRRRVYEYLLQEGVFACKKVSYSYHFNKQTIIIYNSFYQLFYL